MLSTLINENKATGRAMSHKFESEEKHTADAETSTAIMPNLTGPRRSRWPHLTQSPAATQPLDKAAAPVNTALAACARVSVSVRNWECLCVTGNAHASRDRQQPSPVAAAPEEPGPSGQSRHRARSPSHYRLPEQVNTEHYWPGLTAPRVRE